MKEIASLNFIHHTKRKISRGKLRVLILSSNKAPNRLSLLSKLWSVEFHDSSGPRSLSQCDVFLIN